MTRRVKAVGPTWTVQQKRGHKLFSAVEDPKLTPDSIFDRQVSSPVVAEGEMQRLAALIAQVPDPQEKLRVALEQVESKAQQPLPEVERIPIHYYEDGINGFTAALTIRHVIAMHHWLGDPKFSMLDVIRSVVKSMPVRRGEK
jgi:RecB family endonuclease NucS